MSNLEKDKENCGYISDRSSLEYNPEYYDHRPKYVMSDENTGDENELSSSFSLQECMNEYRARRIRRTHLSEQRQNEIKKAYGSSRQEPTEIDLINQNLNNKKQERKCKPCRNGFCYCFTSDSGDSGSHDGCQVLDGLKKKKTQSSRSERTQFLDCSETDRNDPQYKRERMRTNIVYPNAILKSTRKTNSLEEITDIEDNTSKSPIIHITHEIYENSVITEVKFNKTKLQTFGRFIYRRKPEKVQVRAKPKLTFIESNTYSSNTSNLDSFDKKNLFRKYDPYSCEKHDYIGGQLLRKRINTYLKYQRKDVEGDLGSSRVSTSTDKSVREAERFLDNFMQFTGNSKTAFSHNTRSRKTEMEADKKRHVSSLAPKSVISTYPSLDDVEEINEKQRRILNEENTDPLSNDVTKKMDSGSNETKIKPGLNFDSDKKAEAREAHINSCPSISKTEKLFGWKPPQKLNLDEVDGAVHHNLATNFIDKNTPVKGNILMPNQNLNERPVRQNLFWTEKLKQLSPWHNKTDKNCNKNEKKNYSRSKAFIIASRTKLLYLISPKKDQRNQKTNSLFGVQTSNDDPRIKTNKHECNSHLQPDPSMQYSHAEHQEKCSPPINTFDKHEQASFNFSRTVRPPSKKGLCCASPRKLDFPLDCTLAQAFNPLKDYEEKTYHSFNCELDQDISTSKINYILNTIRSKLESSGQPAVCTSQEAGPTTDQNSTGFDCPDNRQNDHIGADETLGNYLKTENCEILNAKEPIYSEIADESIYVADYPDIDSHTSLQHYSTADNPKILYTKVNKRILDEENSHLKTSRQPIPLSNILMDSFKNDLIQSEPLSVETNSNSLLTSSSSQVSLCHSSNSVRLGQQNSCTNKEKHSSKSDLSLQRSELFLENLCLSELLNPDGGGKPAGKVQGVSIPIL